jgi:hypothetical protein
MIEIKHLTDAEIASAIRYLDLDLRTEENEEGTSTVVGIAHRRQPTSPAWPRTFCAGVARAFIRQTITTSSLARP